MASVAFVHFGAAGRRAAEAVDAPRPDPDRIARADADTPGPGDPRTSETYACAAVRMRR